MQQIFGLNVEIIAASLAAILAMLVVTIVVIAIRNRFLIKLSLRNIPRRRFQSLLIIVGLMLASIIVSASLAIGDTMTGSIRNAVLEGIGDIDITIEKPTFGEFADSTITAEEIEVIAAKLYSDSRVDGIMPITTRQAPVVNQRTRLTEARSVLRGYNTDGAVGHFKPESEGGPSPDSRLMPFALPQSVEGETVDFSSLADDEVLVNETLGDILEARAGDTLTVVTPLGRFDFRLRAVMQIGGMAANDRRLLMPLRSMDRIYGFQSGTAERIDVSLDLDNYDLNAASSDIVDELAVDFTDADLAAQIHAGLQPFKVQLTDQIQQFVADNRGTNVLNDENADALEELIAEIERDQPSERFRVLLARDALVGSLFGILGDVDFGDQAFASQAIGEFAFAIGRLERLSAVGYKVFLIEIADIVGNIFFTFFTFFGSFSVIVGLLLIFLIFVLLASERQQEMGIARAVGTKRGHLVQMFTLEGLAYAIGAAAVGTLIGLVVSRGLVVLMAEAFGQTGGDGFSFSFNVTIYSIVSAFSIGLILTLITVIVSAYRVSKLNIVVAIRNLPEEFVASTTQPLLRRILLCVFWIFGPIYALIGLIRSIRTGEGVLLNVLKFVSTLLVVGWILGLAISFVRIFSPFLGQGWPLAILGAAIAAIGFGTETAWQAYIGVSLAVYGIAMVARLLMVNARVSESIASRLAYTTTGIALLLIWGLPASWTDNITGTLDGDIEMFILSGFFLVAAAVWVVMYNSDIIVRGLQETLGRNRAMRPILKPSVAYAVANRFRTGLTVAMFALVIFVLMSFSILNQSFSALLQSPENVTGGFDVRAEINPELPIGDITAAIDASTYLDINDFELIAGQSTVTTAARQVDGEEARFLELQVRGTETDYFRSTELKITGADPDYLAQGTDLDDPEDLARATWEALANDDSLAVITSDHVVEQFGPGGITELMKLEDAWSSPGEGEDFVFRAKEIEIVSGAQDQAAQSVKLTVIGMLDDNAESIEGTTDEGPAPGFIGVYTDHRIFDDLADESVPFSIYRIELVDGVDAGRTASALQTAFLDNAMVAVDTEAELSTVVNQNEQFSLLFQGFMGLGLVVGVAALGVLSLRAVNERRMQIAIMRAIGYRRRMIRIQFILESIFITVIGTASGVALGALTAWSFLQDISDANQGLEFSIPWASISIVVGITIVAALVTTYLPARQASQVFPAEALRYE